MTRNTRGFTLIELMVVIAILVLLVTLVAVSLKSMRGSARRTVSLSALKQIMAAYRSYSDDNRGRLLPGYIGADLQDDAADPFWNLRVTLPGGTVLNPEDAQSYVWRLAPYVDNAWDVFYTELRDAGLMAQLHAEYSGGIYGPFGGSSIIVGGISERPTYGLNSIFVGGDSVHGGTSIADQHPWQDSNPVIAATRFTQVKNPARLIVFSAAAKADDSLSSQVYEDQVLGFCELRAPYLVNPGDPTDISSVWMQRQWLVGTGGLVEKTPPTGFYNDPPGAGLPIVRSGNDVIPVGMLDGSASLEQVSNLSRDMRRWSPFEVALRETGP